MSSNMAGDAALVTASSSGLGRAAAESLAHRGVDVMINGRDEGRLEQTRAELNQQTPGAVRACAGDLTDPDDISRLVSSTVKEFGRLDHLVTSAGGPPSGRFFDIDDEDWYYAFDLLVMSVVILVRASESHLRADKGGTVVTITSRSVKEAIDSLVLSNSVRMGVIGLEKTLSKELAPEIRANAVLPGPHETSRIQDLIEQGVERGEYESYEDGLEERGQGNPLERIGDPGELGDVIAFLCSPEASYINGVAIPVDGGAGKSNL